MLLLTLLLLKYHYPQPCDVPISSFGAVVGFGGSGFTGSGFTGLGCTAGGGFDNFGIRGTGTTPHAASYDGN